MDLPSDLLITPAEMAMIDRAAIASGISGWLLMQAAGEAVAARVLARFPGTARAVVLCGPGNNGGDGYVVVRALQGAGLSVSIFALGDPARLKGDAAMAHAAAGCMPQPLSAYRPEPDDVVIDALFGAGLARPVEGEAAACLERVAQSGAPVVAVDLPSGVSGLTGKAQGIAVQAAETVTFFARKPGHLLLPGRDLCGTLTVADIGIPARYARLAAGLVRENVPDRWGNVYPVRQAEGHKYARGHLGVFSGPAYATGAARLAATAGLAAGAGLVTVAAPEDALPVNAAQLTAVMVRPIGDIAALCNWIGDKRLNAFVIGPGFGVGDKLRDYALALGERHLVVDADGITAFADQRDRLFDAFAGEPLRLVLTPHAGEFARLFPDLAGGEDLSKVEAAQKAAALAHAVVVLKGSDTVVAAPDGRAAINTNAPPWLGTAGAGDVLSGMIGGLLAQGMPAFEAACAAVWIHGEAGALVGQGLTADALPDAVSRVRLDGSHRRQAERR